MLGKRKTYPRSNVTSAGNLELSSPKRVAAKMLSALTSILSAFVISGIPSICESIGPTWAVSPSMLCLPQRIRSYSIPFIAVDSMYDVARVSEPAKQLSLIKTTFAPSRVSGFNALSLLFGPMDTTVTSSDNCNAHSSADSSKGLSSPFTTFTHTRIFINIHRCKLVQAPFELLYIF